MIVCAKSVVFFFTCNLCKSWGHGDFIRTSAFIWIPPKILGGLGRAALFWGGLTLWLIDFSYRVESPWNSRIKNGDVWTYISLFNGTITRDYPQLIPIVLAFWVTVFRPPTRLGIQQWFQHAGIQIHEMRHVFVCHWLFCLIEKYSLSNQWVQKCCQKDPPLVLKSNHVHSYNHIL